jgi:cell division inhibitor SulA/protein ImuA
MGKMEDRMEDNSLHCVPAPDQKEVFRQLLEDNRQLERAGDLKRDNRGLPTGFSELDAVLPEQGWPAQALVEFLLPRLGVGELPLFLSAMAAMTQQQKAVYWIAPPHIPYAPALMQAGVALKQLFLVHKTDKTDQSMFWAMEKALRTESSGMVLGWFSSVPDRVVRRLQLAAEAGRTLGVIFRFDQPQYSPAPVRLRLESTPEALQIHLLKVRQANSVLGAAARPTSIQLTLPLPLP